MDRNFYDNDFEEFLKQKSDQYKMYPSDRVWNNVYSSLHGRKKWWAAGFTLLFIGAGLLLGREVLVTDYTAMAKELNQTTETIAAANTKNTLPQTITNQNTPATVKNAAVQPVVTHIPAGSVTANHSNTAATVTLADNNTTNNTEATSSNSESSQVIENNLLPSLLTIQNNAGLSFSIPRSKLVLNEQVAGKEKSGSKEVAAPINQVEQAAKLPVVKNSKWGLQFYASPTISYRRLANFDNNNTVNIPFATGDAGNINNYVHHKPAPGFELGTNVQYKLSDNLSIFAGAQLNYSRYYIDAFKYHTEKASIALNNAQARDTLSGYTDIRNFSGYAPEQLQNKYLQLSIPVGIEIKILGDKKLQFNIAGGIQPTFLLSSTSYLISSDFKNYIQGPDLARGFNVHTNFEAFISYKTGGLKWQVGPQFRSQLLSSYSDQYRVREFLTEYGIKFGVTRSF